VLLERNAAAAILRSYESSIELTNGHLTVRAFGDFRRQYCVME
jgi:hypothetical protein